MVKRSERSPIIELNLELGMGIGHQRLHHLPTEAANFLFSLLNNVHHGEIIL